MRGVHRGVRYYRYGETGPWVVFTHATGLDHVSFAEQVGVALRHGCQVLLWDMPGHGGPAGSAATAPDSGDLEQFAELLVEVIRHVAGPGARVVLVGHSLGGYLSQHVALRHPELVRALVAIGCTSVTLFPPRRQVAVLRASAVVFRACPPPVRRKLVAHTGYAAAGTRHYVRRCAARTSSSALVRVWWAMARSLRDAPWSRLSCPLLVAHGEHDRTGIIATGASQWVARQSQARYEVVPDAGHYAQLDNAAFVNSMLAAFLTELDVADSRRK